MKLISDKTAARILRMLRGWENLKAVPPLSIMRSEQNAVLKIDPNALLGGGGTGGGTPILSPVAKLEAGVCRYGVTAGTVNGVLIDPSGGTGDFYTQSAGAAFVAYVAIDVAPTPPTIAWSSTPPAIDPHSSVRLLGYIRWDGTPDGLRIVPMNDGSLEVLVAGGLYLYWGTKQSWYISANPLPSA